MQQPAVITALGKANSKRYATACGIHSSGKAAEVAPPITMSGDVLLLLYESDFTSDLTRDRTVSRQ